MSLSDVILIPVASSRIKSIGHLESKSLLYVEFSGGSVYEYKKVSKSMFEEMLDSDSVGQYFEKNIRVKPLTHQYRKVS